MTLAQSSYTCDTKVKLDLLKTSVSIEVMSEITKNSTLKESSGYSFNQTKQSMKSRIHIRLVSLESESLLTTSVSLEKLTGQLNLSGVNEFLEDQVT